MPSLQHQTYHRGLFMHSSPNHSSSQYPWLILFDGLCGWCTGWVRFLVKHDTHRRFEFASLQSPIGQRLLKTHGLLQDELSTFVVITPDGYLTKSTAALTIAYRLGGIWRLLYVLIFLPRAARDRAYDLVARHRYQLRGKFTTCYQPSKEYRDRFRYEV